MWIIVALSLFSAAPVAHPLDDAAVAAVDRAGVVRVSFDGGDRWMAVGHCETAANLQWLDDDLLVDCGRRQQLDGAELRGHWRMLGAPTLAAARPVALVANLKRQRRAAWRGWLPTLAVTVRRDWTASPRDRGSRSTFSVVLRWRLAPAAFAVR